MPTSADRRLVLVHAHPDDEAIATGITMSRYAREGAQVALVTCTRGEQGEIVDPELEHLGTGRPLAAQREQELAAACAALGVADHRFLGDYEDSGMIGTPENDNPRCFWRADLDEAAARLAEVLLDVRPQVVVTYDDNGGYGHPDHIQVHRVTLRAVELAAQAEDPWHVRKVYASAVARSMLQEGIEAFRDSAEPGIFEGVESVDELPFGVDDEVITTEVAGTTEDFERKNAAMRAHRSQISMSGPFFALADNVALRLFGVEHFVLLDGELGPTGGDGRESDLFAGL